jgi:hypothetical protein
MTTFVRPTALLRIAALALLCAAFTLPVHAQTKSAVAAKSQGEPAPEAEAKAIDGAWRGHWMSVSGYVYAADASFSIDAQFKVTGRFHWRLEATPDASPLAAKVGAQGVEHVEGVYWPQAHLLYLKGSRKDDPEGVLGLDSYELILSQNLAVLGGITENHGNWGGLIQLLKQQ